MLNHWSIRATVYNVSVVFPRMVSTLMSATDQTPAASTRALLTERAVTWREASEGSAVLTAAGAAAVALVVLAKVARRLTGRRA